VTLQALLRLDPLVDSLVDSLVDPLVRNHPGFSPTCAAVVLGALTDQSGERDEPETLAAQPGDQVAECHALAASSA
jgi:hypothetical protein